MHEPTFACGDAHFVAQGGPTKTISMQASAAYDSARKVTSFEGSGFGVAGGTAQFSGKLDPEGWSVEGMATALDVKQVRALATPWFKVPANLTFGMTRVAVSLALHRDSRRSA